MGAATVGEVLDRLQAGLDTIAPGSTVTTDGSRFSFTVAGADDLVIAGVAGMLVQALVSKAPLRRAPPPRVVTRNQAARPNSNCRSRRIVRRLGQHPAREWWECANG